jgi:3-methyl-2-oxobutanoate hydroxymethyltransferase
MSTHAVLPKVTVSVLAKMKAAQQKIACLTAYDASFAKILNVAGVDVILVGDSLGMVIQGEATTVPVTVDDMVYHTKCVARANERALLIADMPFMSYATVEQTLGNATRLMQAGGAHMVKLEGGAEQIAVVRALTARGIPVCAHLGLTPQSVHKLGGYRVQGRAPEAAQILLDDALALEAAGADLLVLECVPAQLAQTISQRLRIPVIGIGAGMACDGQVLVLYDVLGIAPRMPKFSRNFMQAQASIADAVSAYVKAVKSQQFPAPEHVLEP